MLRALWGVKESDGELEKINKSNLVCCGGGMIFVLNNVNRGPCILTHCQISFSYVVPSCTSTRFARLIFLVIITDFFFFFMFKFIISFHSLL